MDRGAWGYAVFAAIILSIAVIGLHRALWMEQEARARCEEVDGRDYEGCVKQQYYIIRRNR